MINTLKFKDFGLKTLPDYMFIVVPKHQYGYIILFDSVHLEFVRADTNNTSVDNLLTIDEAIDQDFIAAKDYVDFLTNLNIKEMNNTLDDQLPLGKDRHDYNHFDPRRYELYKDVNINMPIQFHKLYYKKNMKYFKEGDKAYLIGIKNGDHDGYDVLTFEREDGKVVEMRTPIQFYADRHPNIEETLRRYIINHIKLMDSFVGGISKIDICIYYYVQRLNLLLYSDSYVIF